MLRRGILNTHSLLRPNVSPLCLRTSNLIRLTNTTQKRFYSDKKENEDTQNVNQGVKGEKNFSGSLITWRSVGVMVLLGGAALYVLDKMKAQRYKEIHKVASVGDAAIGGPFFLFDQYGKPTADTDFKGKFMFIYFGFTHCPDICPTELTKMAEVVDKLEKVGLANAVAPLLISIDPWRDTVEQMRIYAKEFHPRFLALTGTPAQVNKVAKSYRVFMNKVGSDDDYLLDHSIIEYLVGPDGKFLKFYGKNMSADEIFDSIVQYISPPELSWWVTFQKAFGLA